MRPNVLLAVLIACSISFVAGCGSNASTRTPLFVRTADVTDSRMISITTTDDKTIACDAKNIQVAIGGGPTTIVIEKKDWSDSFITYADNITIYVRTKEQRDAWQKTLGAITAKFYAPRDVLPEDAKTP